MLRGRSSTTIMRIVLWGATLAAGLVAPVLTAQNDLLSAAAVTPSRVPAMMATRTRGVELNRPPMVGPTFKVDSLKARTELKLIGYGDTRFTDPSNVKDTNPHMRKFLVDRIAEEAPDALFETGDLPMTGSYAPDWDSFRLETAPWRARSLRVYPTIGNHEMVSDSDRAVRNYLAAFPALLNCRYYSMQMANVYLISIDEYTSMGKGSREQAWLVSQLEHLPPQVDFVFFLSHMPLVADLQSEIAVGLPRPEETALRNLLEAEAVKVRAKFIVLCGHIHNYERFERSGISYIVTGGGGAKPYPLWVRGREDLYRDTRFPVFHYVVFQVHGAHVDATMYRVDDPSATQPKMEVGERFTLNARVSH